MVLLSALLEIFHRPSIAGVISELMVFAAPLWIAVFVGVVVGWSWRPQWACFFNAECFFPSVRLHLPWFGSGRDSGDQHSSDHSGDSSSSSSNAESSSVVDDNDLKKIFRLTEETDGGPAWILMMNRSMKTMNYQAWRRDPETGPPQYRSRTVYENATAEIVRDFFWDDEFRSKWDDMLLHAETLEESSATGSMVVQWVRKFPFFCSDREYIIGRRIWKAGDAYYCVTKGVPSSAVPRRQKPRRVDLYYSSWCIRPVVSKKDPEQPACEVILFHHEDMGIPWEIAKLGVRQGMWGAVKKIDPGLRAYQSHRATEAALSHSALMAQITTKVSSEYLRWLESSNEVVPSAEIEPMEESREKKQLLKNIPRYLVFGGAVAVACTLDRGLLTKAVMFGVARRFVNMGKRV